MSLSSTALSQRLALAHTQILRAGDLALRHFRNLDALRIDTKMGGQDMVSEADRSVEDLLRRTIATDFPDDSLLGEERGLETGASGWCWIIDPIDGTAPFVAGLPDWCISVAVTYEGRPQIGVILHPLSGDIYSASRGAGATLNGTPLSVIPDAALDRHLMGVGANFRVPHAQTTRMLAALMEAGGMFYRNGSGALMLAQVAAGRLAGYYEPHINAWDCLAGLLLIEEAGGWCAPFPGDRPLTEGGPVLACAPAIRTALCDVLDRAQAPYAKA